MESSEQTRFNKQYEKHVLALKLNGYSDKTIDVYACAVRRVGKHFDHCPDRISIDELEAYFAKLVDSHSWSTVKVDRK